MEDIALNLLRIQQTIAECEEKFNRPPGSVTLLAISKGHSLEKIQAAIAAGQTCFGENHVQEALAKINVLSDPAIEWHFVGNIQKNKTRKIAENFAWVHSLAEIKIAERLNEQRPLHLPPLNVCIEVNVNLEPSKSGILISDLSALATYCQGLKRLRLRGLMCIPEVRTDFNLQRKNFHTLFSLYQHLREQHFSLDTLSMGMSDDFGAAIAAGATIVRVGTAIFGERE